MFKAIADWFNSVDALISPSYFYMDPKFNVLADYNSEVSRGILHTSEHKAKMIELQIQYNELIVKHARDNNMVVL